MSLKLPKMKENGNKLDSNQLTPTLYSEFSKCLKDAIGILGQKILTDFIQGYDVKTKSINIENVEYRYKFESPKKYLTYFGEIEINRSLYQHDRGGDCHFPLDKKWGMVNEYAAPEVQEAVLYSTAHLTPKEVEELLKKSSFFNPSATAIKNLINESAIVISKNEEEINNQILKNECITPQAKILVSSMDGVNVLLREKGVKKGKKNQRPKIKKTTEKKNTCYKNAMVGTISFYERRKEDKKHPNRLETKYISRMPEEKAVNFKKQFENQLKDTLKKCDNNIDKLLLFDGARGLWNYAAGNDLYNDFEKLIDFYHTTDHLSKAAEALFGKKNEKANKWFNKYRESLLNNEDGAKNVIRSIQYYSDKLKLRKISNELVKVELTFFRRNKDKMNYYHFLSKGWPIGSGPVEAACKSIVKTRLCRSGMRWSILGGQAILNLRTFVKSNRWDQFWSIYQELKQCA